MKTLTLLMILLIFSSQIMATSYYFANDGNDANNGLSAETPWKNINKIKQLTLKPGDEILLKAGDIFVGNITIAYSGTAKYPIKISSYSNGAKPILTGAVAISNWKLKSDKIYETTFNQNIYSLFDGNHRLPLARWPDSGYFKIDDGNKISLTDNRLATIDYDLSGATARIKSVDWQSETMTIKEHIKDKIIFNEKMIYSCKKDYGYILDNKYEFLNINGEWFYNTDNNTLYGYFNRKPQNTEACITNTGITIKEGVKYLIIDNIRIEKYNTAGIKAERFSQNITITHCSLHHATTYGINIEEGTKNITISHCYIADIPGRGISTLESSNLLIENNALKRIGLLPGYGFNGVNNEVAIAILRKETLYFISDKTIKYLKAQNAKPEVMAVAQKIKDLPFSGQRWFKMELEKYIPHEKEWIEKLVQRVKQEVSREQLQSTRNTVRNNYIDSVGYVGIRLDGTHSLAERNIVKNTILHMNDGGAIYCWGQHYDYTHHNIIRQNIVINPVGSAEATPNNRLFGIGIYVDNRCNNITIEKNIVMKAKAGILINDDSFDNIIQNNTTYDNLYGVMFSEFYKPGSLKGCVTENNIFFCKQRHQRCVFNETRLSEKLHASVFDNNFYGSPYYTYPLLELTYKNGVRRYHEYTLESWQREKNTDAHSKELAPKDPEDRGNESFILINDTGKVKTFTIKNDRRCYDVNGNLLDKKVKIKPFTALIVVLE